MEEKNYEAMYDGYIGEENYRKGLIDRINETKYVDLKEICYQLSYALSNYDLIRIAKEYKKGDKEFNAKAEYLLTDMNFHSECAMLIDNPDKLIDSCKSEIDNAIEDYVSEKFRISYLKNGNNGFINNNTIYNWLISQSELFFMESKGILEPYGDGYELTDKYIEDYFSKKSKDDIEL